MSSLDVPNVMKKVFPAAADYGVAVMHLDRFVFVPVLAGGRPRTFRSSAGNSNELECYSGGYSRVYPIQVGNKTWALRCWIKYPGNVKDRWQKARDYLFWNASSYFVPFDYADDGILVNGQRFPVSYMEWVEGDTLAGFLDKYMGQSAIILQLAEKFLSMVRELHKGKISHGDLQDGNLMVRMGDDGQVELKLIDYDSIFVPGLEHLNGDGIPGVANYQHPNRSDWSQMNERADYFSELVIYLSLRAYAERPDLWRRGQEQELLFTAEDFKDPAGSIMFKSLSSLSDEVRWLSHYLKEFGMTSSFEDLKPLELVLEQAARSVENGDVIVEVVSESPPLPPLRRPERPQRPPDREPPWPSAPPPPEPPPETVTPPVHRSFGNLLGWVALIITVSILIAITMITKPHSPSTGTRQTEQARVSAIQTGAEKLRREKEQEIERIKREKEQEIERIRREKEEEAKRAKDANSITFLIKSDYKYRVQVNFYSSDSNRTWPSSTRSYVIADSEVHVFSLDCDQGEKICYGAWPDGDPRTYWGVGHNGREGCKDCCYTCGSGTTRVITLGN